VQQTKLKPKVQRGKQSSARLSPKQPRRLADRMVAASDPVEAARLKQELERGFYGDPAPA
jgi:hypothetical protein